MSGAPGGPFEATGKGLVLAVRLKPAGGANRIEGLVETAEGGRALAVRVTAPAAEGRANAALIALLAKAWRLPKGDLSILSGAHDRNKRILVAPGEPERAARLQSWLDEHLGN